MTTQKEKVIHRMTACIVLAALALPITGYLLYAHYSKEASEFCNFSESFNCEIVNQSIYSELFGIPVSALGLLAYLAMLLVAVRARKVLKTGLRKKFTPEALVKTLVVFSALGTLFSLYLTYIEAFVLMTWCIFCVTQQILILLIFILSFSALRIISGQKKEQGTVCEFC